MIVYHGNYTKITEIDSSMTMYKKDFEKGFYVTKIGEHAKNCHLCQIKPFILLFL